MSTRTSILDSKYLPPKDQLDFINRLLELSHVERMAELNYFYNRLIETISHGESSPNERGRVYECVVDHATILAHLKKCPDKFKPYILDPEVLDAYTKNNSKV